MKRLPWLAIAFPCLALLVLVGCARVRPHYLVPSVQIGDPAFFPTIEANTRAPILAGNHVEILLNGDELFPAMLEAIRSARRTITFLQYYYEAGEIPRQFAEALAERCRAGVGVNVLLDSAGALLTPAEYIDVMKQSGCHVAWFRPLRPWQLSKLNHRNHRRIVVVDGRVGFTGGFGISDKWIGDGRTAHLWRETSVRVEGPSVEHLQAAFAQDWRETTGIILVGAPYFPSLEEAGSVSAQVVSTSALGGGYEAYLLFLLTIESARRSIDITNPYFVPDDRIEEALIRAVERGVRVRALLPGMIDHNLVREASRRGFGKLLKAGIEIWEYQAALLHSKTMVVDGVWATVGSTNLDNRSLAINEELNLTVYDRGLASRLERIFEDDLSLSNRVTLEQWKSRGLRARLLELVSRPLKEQL